MPSELDLVNDSDNTSDDDPSVDESFLTRWSRRKHAAGRPEQQAAEPSEPVDEQPDPRADTAAPQQAGAETEADDAEAEPPGDEDMPPLDSIDEGGSVAAFFSPRVSEGLRRLALRRLWRQPEFSGEDLLDDYARDYSRPEPLGDIVTAEMRYRAEQLRKRLERKLKEGLAETSEGASPADADAGRVAASEEPAAPEQAAESCRIEGHGRAVARSSDTQADHRSDKRDPDGLPESDRNPV